jgi:hypothetical protein
MLHSGSDGLSSCKETPILTVLVLIIIAMTASRTFHVYQAKLGGRISKYARMKRQREELSCSRWMSMKEDISRKKILNYKNRKE